MFRFLLPLSLAASLSSAAMAQQTAHDPASTGSPVQQAAPGNAGAPAPLPHPFASSAPSSAEPVASPSATPSQPPAGASVLALPGGPTSAPVLTLQTALAMALASNPELRVARHETGAASAALDQAGVRPNPAIELGLEDTRRDSRETTIVLSQTLELGGKRQARVTAAGRALDSAHVDLEARQADTAGAVIAAFFDVLTEQERVSLAREALELARRASHSTASRVTAGRASPVEVSRARVAESGVRIELLQAGTALAGARKRLAMSWGGSDQQFGAVEGEITRLPPAPELARLAEQLENAPALRRAQAEIRQRQALLEVERARRIPDLTLSLGARRSNELGRNQAIVGVAMPLPVFDTNHGNILAAQKRLDQARDELAGTRQRLEGELAMAAERLASLRDEAQLMASDVLPGATSAYSAASTGFEYGKFAFLDVLDAQRTLLAARVQYLRTLSEAQRAAADMGRLLGLSLNEIAR